MHHTQQTVDRFCFQTFAEGSLTPASSHELSDLLIRSAVLYRSCLLSHLTFPGIADCSPFSRKVCTIKLSHSRGSLQAHLLLDQGVEKYNSFRSKCALRNWLTPGLTHKLNPSLRQRCASQPCSKDVAPPPLHLPTKEGHHRPRRGSRICLGLMFKLLGRTIAQRRM